MESFKTVIDLVGTLVDLLGVLIILLGIATATWRLFFAAPVRGDCRIYRHEIGRAILLGLEFLVAGDIIRTVIIAPTLQNVLVLGLIVLIRTFLSFSLQLEMDGRWPWQHETTGKTN